MSFHKLSRLAYLLVASIVLTALCCGCGRVSKGVKQAREGARMAQDMKDDGEMTIKGEDGETVTIKADDSDGEGGTVTIQGKDGESELHVDEDEGETSWTVTDEDGETATGSVSQDVSEADVGLKFYPGATVEHGSQGSTTAGEGASWKVVSLTTKDPVDKVTGFYKKTYPDAAQVIEGGEGFHMVVAGSAGGGKTVTVAPAEDEGVTRIILSSGSR